MLRGLDPRWRLLLERENPRTLLSKSGNITGANLTLSSSRIAAYGCHCNTGGYMTFREALVIAVVTSIIGPIVVALVCHSCNI